MTVHHSVIYQRLRGSDEWAYVFVKLSVSSWFMSLSFGTLPLIHLASKARLESADIAF